MSIGGLAPWMADDALLDRSDWQALIAALAAATEPLVAAQSPGIAESQVVELEQALEDRLIQLVRDCFGPVPVLAEETFHRTGARLDGAGEMMIVLDPLDGSRSYAAGTDTYAVSIAGCRFGEPEFGLVFQPAGARLYSARTGGGAWVGETPLVHGRTAPPRRAAVRSGIVSDPATAAAVDQLRGLGYQLERMECTSLKFCWLAEGRRAGLIKQLVERRGELCTWGTAAGHLVATEAGVPSRRLDGGPWRWSAGTVLAGDDRFLADLGLTDGPHLSRVPA
jgi:3'(2'), 5'-bisphosphate nucleotidase